MTFLAVSTPVLIVLVAGLLVGLAFVAALIGLTIRRRGAKPDIPTGMRPGPADEVLERRHLERIIGYAMAFVVFSAVWLPVYWLREPDAQVAGELELIRRSEERGSHWFQVASPENPTGFGCAQCHGAEAQGGVVPFTTPDGQFIPDYPVPALNNVCGGAAHGHPTIESLEDIRTTIEQGRPGTPMPSWSVEVAGPMNDQQIDDLLFYIASIQEIPEEDNLCVGPAADVEGAVPAPTPAPDASPSPSPEETG